MRALYQLNEEKLEYNLKVLEAKDKENIDLTVSLKKQSQINIQRLRKLQMKYKETDATFRQKNKELTDNFKKNTLIFKELQIKFKHFVKSDVERIEKIKAMKEAEIRKLQDKIKKADKIIHIQQLGR